MRCGKFLLPLLFLLLGGCAGHSSFTEEKRQNDFHPEQVRNLYIYSFLDARREYTGEKLFPVFQKTLDERLARHGVTTHWLWYEDSSFGQSFSAAEKGSAEGYGKMIPVGLVTLLNRKEEQASGATHRLVIFPKTVGLTGIHQAEEEYYALISWSLERTDKPNDVQLKGTSNFYSRPRRATSDLQDDVDGLVDDFLATLYPQASQGAAGNR